MRKSKLNRVAALASVAIVSALGISRLNAERQVRVWLLNSGSFAQNDMVEATGISRIVTGIRDGASSVIYTKSANEERVSVPIDDTNGPQIGSISLPTILPHCSLITNLKGQIQAVNYQHDWVLLPEQADKPSFALERDVNGVKEQVDMVEVLKRHIKAEQSRFAGLTANALAGGGDGLFIHKMSELQQDLDALNSIPEINDPSGVIALPKSQSIILCYSNQSVQGIDPVTFAAEPQRFVVLKFSTPLYNNLWRLVQ
jgi:hypothetical protein